MLLLGAIFHVVLNKISTLGVQRILEPPLGMLITPARVA